MATGKISKPMKAKRYRDTNKEKGLCVDCSKKAVDGMVRCEYHLKKQREYRGRYLSSQFRGSSNLNNTNGGASNG